MACRTVLSTASFKILAAYFGLGTWDGLNMFNSRDIRVFKPDLLSSLPSISNNIIRNVIEERKGVIWVATDYGINRYDINKDEFQNFFCANTRKKCF